MIYFFQAERGRQSPYSKGFFVCHCGADLCKKANKSGNKNEKYNKNICIYNFFAVSLQAKFVEEKAKKSISQKTVVFCDIVFFILVFGQVFLGIDVLVFA